jgi:hypothetical protein
MGDKESEMPRNECGVICFPDSAEKLNLKELFKKSNVFFGPFSQYLDFETKIK